MGGQAGSLSGAWRCFRGDSCGEKVSEGNHRLREAQRAIEELEEKLAGMGTRDDGVKVEEGGTDHRLGNGKPTPRKDTVIFRANWVKIPKEGIYRVVEEDKYHGHVPAQNLLRPSALRVKCEMDTQCDHLNVVRDVLAERERTPST